MVYNREQVTEVWNNAQGYHYLLQQIDFGILKAQMNQDYENMLISLKTKMDWIYRYLKQDERKQAQKLISECEQVVNRSQSYLNQKSSPEHKLRMLHQELNDYVHKYGLDMPKKDDPSAAILG